MGMVTTHWVFRLQKRVTKIQLLTNDLNFGDTVAVELVYGCRHLELASLTVNGETITGNINRICRSHDYKSLWVAAVSFESTMKPSPSTTWSSREEQQVEYYWAMLI